MLPWYAVFAIDGLSGMADDASVPDMRNAHAGKTAELGHGEVGKLATSVLSNGAVGLARRISVAVKSCKDLIDE